MAAVSVSTQTARASSSSVLTTALTAVGLRTPAARWTALAAAGAAALAAGLALWSRRPKPIRSCRPLHWVLKVSDLRASVDFYTRVLGLCVQRHEEFDVGCEATCNGPYSGWWSKTMMSFPGRGEEAFSLELTYNYGVDSYELGNDLAGIHVRVAGAAQRARDMGLAVAATEQPGVVKVQNPDGQCQSDRATMAAIDAIQGDRHTRTQQTRFFLHEATSSQPGGADADVQTDADPFLFVSLNTTDLARSKSYYTRVLGMREFGPSETSWGAQAGVAPGAATALLGFSDRETKLQLIELPRAVPLSHGASFGRIAFGGFEVVSTFERARAAGGVVLNEPITLETPGKATVLVTILADPDGNEICVVDDAHFRALCVTRPGDERISWESRAKRIAAQSKFQKAFEAN